MFGESDNNRSQDQGRRREAIDPKEGGGKGTTVGKRTGSEAAMRAMSVLANAKSNRHRKTHQVEPDGAGREFTHLTRGGLPSESTAGVSRGRSSEEARGNPGGAKGRRGRDRRDRQPPPRTWAGRSPKPARRDNYGRLLAGCAKKGRVASRPIAARGDQVRSRARRGQR
jgi:hypothetical protein